MIKEQFKIERRKLEHLYFDQNLSISSIAKMYNCSYATIWGRMRKFKIKPRSLSEAMKLIMETRKLQIPEEELRNFYEKRKFSILKIAKIYNCHHQTVLCKMKGFGIKSRKPSEANTIYVKHNFLGNLSEKAYLIGFRTGDLYVYRINKGGETIRIEGTSTKPTQIRLIEKLFSRYGHIYKYKIKGFRGDSFWRIHYLVNSTFNFLLNKISKIPPWVLNNEKYFFSFLAGYIDAEGCIYIANTKIPQANFVLSSYDKNILFQLWKKLNLLNICCPKPRISAKRGYITEKKPIPYTQNYWGLSVHSKSSLINLFNKILPFVKHEEKKEMIQRALKNIQWRNKTFGDIKMK